MMPIWQAILLGVIQGLTEFLPISSTAHLLVARKALRHAHPEDAFTTVIQLGTLFAVLIFFRRDLIGFISAVAKDCLKLRFAATPKSRMAWLIVLGTIPVVIAGFTLKKWLKANFYDLASMAMMAIIFSLLMLASELWYKIRRDEPLPSAKKEDHIGWRDAIWVGLWQALALFPGASRSGTTITGGLFGGLTREAAARFSFLLSLPSVFGAGMKELYDEYKLWKNPDLEPRPSLFASGDELVSLAIGTLVSAIVGYLAIAWLLGFLRKYSMNIFVVYRILLGLGILFFLAARYYSPK
jgi:undecaprenyl-diphosphatase